MRTLVFKGHFSEGKLTYEFTNGNLKQISMFDKNYYISALKL